jgi:hypothetical protein
MIPLEDKLAWQQTLSQLFVATVPPLEGTLAETVAEALVLPTVDEALKQAVPLDNVPRQLEGTIGWARRILRASWIDEEALGAWLAVPRSVSGLDALLGGWHTEQGLLQLVATHDRFHVRVRLPAKNAPTATGTVERATELAISLFATDLQWPVLTWQRRSLGDFTIAYRETPFPTSWIDSCLIVSDGTAVKYSFLKIVQSQSPPAGDSALRDLSPWFPEQDV